MSGMDKAQAFCKVAHENGWTTKITTNSDDETHVRAERANEAITIWWQDNSLVETPFHHFGGQVRSLHNKADATRQLGLKPDATKVVKRPSKLKLTAEGADLEGVDIETIRSPLPFDIWESSDAEIMKELRGSTIIWLNRISQQPESAHIAKPLNMNLNHFYLAQSSDDKPYVAFLAATGFRAVHLESILRVM